ncbi:hypothetical protein [Streptomyces flaveus]|uniref:Uncharacterized protein n=1 Tax=Streptomyces flaveus TaxID=66370 RepID=A0A917VPI1_9ACTN|nr:hypothetical protein GCM10010094_77240 [Streptomyces flaveus]
MAIEARGGASERRQLAPALVDTGPPVEVPVGAWTSLFGVPVGVALLRSGKRRPKSPRPDGPSGTRLPSGGATASEEAR